MVVSFSLFFCSRKETTETNSGTPKKLPDQEIWEFQAKSTVNGKLEALIHAGHMQRFNRDELMLFDSGVQVDFFDENGEHASVLTSDTGEYNSKTEDVKAIGNVVVVSDSGITLYTEELFYYRQRDQIISNTDVKVETEEGHILHGVGFRSDAQMNSWQIDKPYDGVAPEGFDLSLDRFEKKETVDSTSVDTLAISDSTLVDSMAVIDSTVIDTTRVDTMETKK
jgi:LPS export ABC transporter protein LptC